MNAPGVDEKAVAIDHALTRSLIPHAFGGALALGFYAEPRATRDIDVNVFVPVDRAGEVLDVLRALGIETGDVMPTVQRDAQCRLFWGDTPVDLFFTNMAFHTDMQKSVRQLPFGPDVMPFIGPEHLMVCKALFDRRKDWFDIEQMLITVPDLRVGEVTRWMDEIGGADDHRTIRLRALIAELLGR